MNQTNKVLESENFIIVNEYTKQPVEKYIESEADMENDLIDTLQRQGYQYLKDINTEDKLINFTRTEINRLNNVELSDDEWERFKNNYLLRRDDSYVDCTKKFQINNYYDLEMDDGSIKNICIIDKKNLYKNRFQVINQMKKEKHRYDVTILLNGIPMIQIELKKRGIKIKDAFNQIQERYKKTSFFSNNSLYKYLQLFVISNGTYTKYFPNTQDENKNTFKFSNTWAREDNKRIEDIQDFAVTFLTQNAVFQILTKYLIFDTNNNLISMRSYQIAATERIVNKIRLAINEKIDGNGYIWHTTGSGKTLTSFKAALLATKLEMVDYVFFVVDRRDLDNQTMIEYKKFSELDVTGSGSTKQLEKNIKEAQNKIIVTTIQKLNRFIKKQERHKIYTQNVVMIFDEAHRSQFGEVQREIKKKFKNIYQFGFTGTPIFKDDDVNNHTTIEIFKERLHTYNITDAFNDKKVLTFKYQYYNVSLQYKSQESETSIEDLNRKKLLLADNRIENIAENILKEFPVKTRRGEYNAFFTVDSVEAIQKYYKAFKELQKEGIHPDIKVAAIFSIDINKVSGEKKEFIEELQNDYNRRFNKNYNILDQKEYQEYYKDVSEKIKAKEIDILIIHNIFLTGFDAPTLNTLFVDRHLAKHTLIQAFSRTNRVESSRKEHGNIISFRNLDTEVEEAFKMYSGEGNSGLYTIKDSFEDLMYGYDKDENTRVDGLIDITKKLREEFNRKEEILSSKEKKKFVDLYSQYLRFNNKLEFYTKYAALKEYRKMENDGLKKENIKAELLEDFNINEKDIYEIEGIEIASPVEIKDYESYYQEIYEDIQEKKENNEDELDEVYQNIEFEIELLTQENIDLDYLLNLMTSSLKDSKTKEDVEEVKKIVKKEFKKNLSHREKWPIFNEFFTAIENKSDDFFGYLSNIDDEEKEDSIRKGFKVFANEKAKKRVFEISEEAGEPYEKILDATNEVLEGRRKRNDPLFKRNVMNKDDRRREKVARNQVFNIRDTFSGIIKKINDSEPIRFLSELHETDLVKAGGAIGISVEAVSFITSFFG